MLKSLFDLPQLDAQLADMDSHREKAVAAVGKGNSVLQDAANTLRTLKGRITIFLDLANFLNIQNCNCLSAISVVYFHQRLSALHFIAGQNLLFHTFCMFSLDFDAEMTKNEHIFALFPKH